MRPVKTHSAQGRLVAKRNVVGPRRCRKQCYTSKKIAKARAVAVSKEIGEPIHAYKCVPCHAWHIGHPPGWKEARRDGLV